MGILARPYRTEDGGSTSARFRRRRVPKVSRAPVPLRGKSSEGITADGASTSWRPAYAAGQLHDTPRNVTPHARLALAVMRCPVPVAVGWSVRACKGFVLCWHHAHNAAGHYCCRTRRGIATSLRRRNVSVLRQCATPLGPV